MSANSQLFSFLLLMIVSVGTEKKPDFWTLIITPHQERAREMYADLRQFCSAVNIPVELVSSTRVLSRPRGKQIRVVAARILLMSFMLSDPLETRFDPNLVICEDLEQLDSTYEWAVCLLRHATQFLATRYVGFSASLDDPTDLADWLNVHPTALISFRPRDRDQALSFSVQPFTIPHSASLFKAMGKPTHTAIKTVPLGENAIIFVSSRAMCRPTALNLLTQRALEMESARGYIPETTSDEYIEDACVRLQDASLADFVSKGVGFFHGGIKKQDRLIILGLYAEGIIRVLIVPHDSVMSLPVRAAVVIVMGTQYIGTTERSKSGDHQVLDYSLSTIVRMQSHAVRHSGAGHFFLFCQAEAKDTLTRFLSDGLPLESQIAKASTVVEWLKTRKSDWKDKKQDLINILSFSFLARRVATNPSYYDCTSTDRNGNLSRIVDGLFEQVPQA